MSKKKAGPFVPEVYASRSDVGNVREHNEDSFIARSPLFVVADGMGGHEAGEVASEIAINTMAEHMPESCNAEALAHAVCEANLAVLRGAADGTGRPGMGTTMTAAAVFDDEVVIAQVGDSRAYLLHEGSLQRITRDHSLVADLVEQGRITEEEARVHPQRSVITRALGSDPHMQPDTYRLHVDAGDKLLLCSDGLSSMIDDAAIEAVMQANPVPEDACNALVSEALAAGGYDNVTVVVVDLTAEADDDGIDVEGDASAAAPKHSKKKGKGRKAPIFWAIAFVLVIAAACGGFYAYAQNSYYLIAENGHVTLYRGLPGDFGGLSFSWVEEETDVEVAKLAPTTANRLERGISVDSKEAADELIASYREATTTVSGEEAVTATDAQAAAGDDKAAK